MRTGLARAPRAAGRGVVRTGRGVATVGRWASAPARFAFRFLTRSPETTLFVLAAILFVIAWATLSLTHDVTVSLRPVVALVETAPLLLARIRPMAGWAISIGGAIGFALADMALPGWQMPWPVVHFLVLLTMVAAVALRARWQEVAGAVGGTAVVFGLLLPEELRPWAIGQALLAGVALLVRWLVLSRRQLAIETVSTQEERARRAVLEERSMIARELHDVVAHHMSLIVVQAQSAPYRLDEVGDDAKAEFTSIEQSARAALNEVRAVLGVLRTESHEVASAPVPGGADLVALLESSRAAGLPLTWGELPPTLASVPPGVGLAAYRILQESLANASRHAPGAAVRAQVSLDAKGLSLSVENSVAPRLPGPGRETGGGSGLLGARTRAESAGGTLAAGPTPTRGFRVEAVLPATVTDPGDADDDSGSGNDADPASNPGGAVEASATTASDTQGQ
ncbi:sensor histidine kinase [Pedococcus bigeumensis]|uniref:sensor histidine kinase n=1 Tax=Pedococcus bigeumensis TaxID=433644 RepID=UPI0019D584FC|nr:histidine kinase [Pedococcus bigeumensis]